MDSAPPAFGDHDDDSIGVVRIESTWRQHTDSADKATSTNRIETANAKIQVIKRCDVETSTGAMLAPLVRHLDSAQAAGLERFFRARLDDTIALLRRNARSTAFDGYDPSAWDDGAEPVSCVHALKDTTGRAAIAPESVTAVVWNCTGAIVVAAYGVLDGADGLSWAARKSVLCAWSVTRRSLSAGKADSIVELDDSVACLAFHPTEPTLLAGGAFNGDVLLWDVSNDEQPLRFKSTLSDYSHLEPVTRLAWTRPLGRERHDLVSLGADGKVLVWRPDEEAHRLLHPVGGFILLAPSATSAAKAYAASGGDALGGGGSAGGGGGGIERVHGGMALSFAPEDPNSFVVGVEAGLVLKCSLGADRRKFAPLLPLDPSLKWSADAEAVMAARAGAADFMRIKLKVEKVTRAAVLLRRRTLRPAQLRARSRPPAPRRLDLPAGRPARPCAHAPPARPRRAQAALLAHEREITLATLYGAGLSASALFGSPRVFDYEPHAGVVYDAAHSPFCRNLFLTVSTDSAVRLYSMLQVRPRPAVRVAAAARAEPRSRARSLTGRRCGLLLHASSPPPAPPRVAGQPLLPHPIPSPSVRRARR
jgi:WD40 repeat protein